MSLTKLEIKPGEKVLLYGIGNVGRQDDGLGIRLMEKLERVGLPDSFTLEANYQVNIEDALLMADYDVVLFADASKAASNDPFSLRLLEPNPSIGFTTHAMELSSVLALCQELYARNPRTYLLALPGYDWDVSEVLSEKANRNLELAFDYLLKELPCTKSP